MRQGEAIALELDVAQDEQVEVERARTVAGSGEDPAVLGFDRLADVEQLIGLALGANARRGVEEVGLIDDLADGLCLVRRGDRLDLDSVAAQIAERPAQVLLALAQVGAEPDVADALAQTPLSSSSTSIWREPARSSVSSTAASWTR